MASSNFAEDKRGDDFRFRNYAGKEVFRVGTFDDATGRGRAITNFLETLPSEDGDPVVLKAMGQSDNIAIELNPKGTGGIVMAADPLKVDKIKERTASAGVKVGSEFYVDTIDNGSNEFEVNAGDVHVKGRDFKVDTDDDGTSELWVATAQTQVRNLLEADAGLSFDNGTTTLSSYLEASGTLTFDANNPGYTVAPTLDYRAVRIGNMVMLHLDDFSGIPDSSISDYFRTSSGALAVDFQPWRTLGLKVKVRDNGSSSDGFFEVTSSGRVAFFRNNASNFTAQTVASNEIGDCSISYAIA